LAGLHSDTILFAVGMTVHRHVLRPTGNASRVASRSRLADDQTGTEWVDESGHDDWRRLVLDTSRGLPGGPLIPADKSAQ
jgi:hypothetical protein